MLLAHLDLRESLAQTVKTETMEKMEPQAKMPFSTQPRNLSHVLSAHLDHQAHKGQFLNIFSKIPIIMEK